MMNVRNEAENFHVWFGNKCIFEQSCVTADFDLQRWL